MRTEILAQQRIIGHDQQGDLKVGVVEPQRGADGTVYRVDVRYGDNVLCNQDDSLIFQRSLGGGFDALLKKGVDIKARRERGEWSRDVK